MDQRYHGNQDPHTNTILHNRTFSISRSGSAIPFDAAALYNMVAFDHRRRKHRLTLGEYQGPTRSQLVLALSSDLPRQLLERSSPLSQRRSAPSPSTPLTLNNIPPFGVYFCRKPTLTALRRDGIHPTSQSTRQGNPLNIALKLQAALQPEMADMTFYSPLNQQRHGLYLLVNLPATLEAGFTWYMLDPQKRYHWYPQSPSSCRLLPLRSRHRIRAGRPPLDSYPQ